MSRHYSQLERERIITLHNQGYGCTTIAKELDLTKQSVLLWINRYLKRGLQGLETLHNVNITPAFRLRVVGDLIKNALSLEQTALKHNVSRSAVTKWLARFNAGDYALLSQHTLGHKTNSLKTNTMGRPRKREPQTELEKLRYENEYLRTENALLKKVRALVEQQQSQLRDLGQRPSKN